MRSNGALDMEKFIEYKTNNRWQSETRGKLYKLKAQYQAQLNTRRKLLEARQKQMSILEYENKKIVKHVQNQLCFYASSIKEIEATKQYFEKQMFDIEQQRANRLRQLEQFSEAVQIKEEQLIDKVKQFINQSQGQQRQQQQNLQELRDQISQLFRQINEIQPTVQQHSFKMLNWQNLNLSIDAYKNEIQNLKKTITNNKQHLQALNAKAIQNLKVRQNAEKNLTEDRKQQFVILINQINQILGKRDYKQIDSVSLRQIIEKKRTSVSQIQSRDDYMGQKMKQIKQKVTGGDKQWLNRSEQIQKLVTAQISRLDKQNQQSKRQEKMLLARQKSLKQEQASKDKEIENLEQTVTRIINSINKL